MSLRYLCIACGFTKEVKDGMEMDELMRGHRLQHKGNGL